MALNCLIFTNVIQTQTNNGVHLYCFLEAFG